MEMAQLRMFPGIWERCFFVRRGDSQGEELMCVKYNEFHEKITSDCLWKQKDKILQININHHRNQGSSNMTLFEVGG